jgi:hypothetical protein
MDYSLDLAVRLQQKKNFQRLRDSPLHKPSSRNAAARIPKKDVFFAAAFFSACFGSSFDSKS